MRIWHISVMRAVALSLFMFASCAHATSSPKERRQRDIVYSAQVLAESWHVCQAVLSPPKIEDVRPAFKAAFRILEDLEAQNDAGLKIDWPTLRVVLDALHRRIAESGVTVPANIDRLISIVRLHDQSERPWTEK